jgi:WD40 repeat protein
LTSLHVSPGGDFLALGGSDASLSLWDLRVLDLPLLFSRPFARTMPRQLAAIGILVGDPAQSAPIHRSLEYLECALRHRFRYDVEIGEMLSIRTGEFDIEIEG